MKGNHVFAALGLLLVLAGCNDGFGGGGSSISASTASTVPAATTAPASPSSAPTLTSLTIETGGLTLSTPGAGQQLQASGVYSDGHVRDVTRVVTWSVADATVLSIDGSAIAWPVAAGQTTIEADLGGLSATAPLAVDPAALAAPPAPPPAPAAGVPTWDADVFPLLRDSLTCKSCHEHPKGRFKITLREDVDYVFMTTHAYFEPTNPALSRFVLKATAEIAHGGGKTLDPSDPAIATVEAWVAGGMPYDAAGHGPAPTVATALAALPPPNALLLTPPARNLVDPGQTQQLVVLAWWMSGATADVTQVAEIKTSDATIASVDSNGLLTASGSAGTVTVSATWQGVIASGLCACDPSSPLGDGNDADCITLNAGAPPTITCPSGATTPAAAPAGSFTTTVDPLFYGSLSCSNCHTATSAGVFHLFNDPVQDLAGLQAGGLVDASNAAGSLLLTTSTNATGNHPGGVALDPTSADYATILGWIQAGAH